MDKCSDGDYAYEITILCIIGSSCGTGYYHYAITSLKQQNICVTQCPSDKPYLGQVNNCVIGYSGEYDYYIKEFIHGETDI